jgi:hypothetical protein
MRLGFVSAWREISKIGRLANTDDFGPWAKFIQTG